MIIWSGYGFMIFIIVFVDSLLANLVTNYISREDNFYDTNMLPLGISFLFSALIIKLVSDYFKKKRAENKGTYIFDKTTIAKANHRLFFIPFIYWSYIMLGLGIGVILYQVFVKQGG